MSNNWYISLFCNSIYTKFYDALFKSVFERLHAFCSKCVCGCVCVCACECAGEKQGFCKIHLGGFFILILNQSKAASLTNWNLKCVFLFPIILSCILVSARPVGVEVQFVFRCECPSTLVGGCEHWVLSFNWFIVLWVKCI